MNESSTQSGGWEKILVELRAYRDNERKTWGETDDIAIARYLSGRCTADERQAVENAMASYPAVRQLVDFVRQALAVPRAEVTPAAAPIVWRAAGLSAELAERLVAWMDETGRLLATGLEHWFATPQLALGQCMGPGAVAGEAPEAAWHIPLPEDVHCRLTISIRPTGKQDEWSLSCKLLSRDGGSPPPQSRLEMSRESGELELSGWLDDYLNEPIRLLTGEWCIAIEIRGHTQRIHIAIGVPPSP